MIRFRYRRRIGIRTLSEYFLYGAGYTVHRYWYQSTLSNPVRWTSILPEATTLPPDAAIQLAAARM